eukprot:1256578-Rhodomonas_salina.1
MQKPEQVRDQRSDPAACLVSRSRCLVSIYHESTTHAHADPSCAHAQRIQGPLPGSSAYQQHPRSRVQDLGSRVQSLRSEARSWGTRVDGLLVAGRGWRPACSVWRCPFQVSGSALFRQNPFEPPLQTPSAPPSTTWSEWYAAIAHRVLPECLRTV